MNLIFEIEEMIVASRIFAWICAVLRYISEWLDECRQILSSLMDLSITFILNVTYESYLHGVIFFFGPQSMS